MHSPQKSNRPSAPAPGGFKSASATPNLLKQVLPAPFNRLQPVLCGSGGIDPAGSRQHACSARI
jgi:hypothetical protein